MPSSASGTPLPQPLTSTTMDFPWFDSVNEEGGLIISLLNLWPINSDSVTILSTYLASQGDR